MSILTIAIVLAVLATVYSLACGVSAMATGGEVGHRKSEQWMVWRVVFQAVTLALVVIAVLS